MFEELKDNMEDVLEKYAHKMNEALDEDAAELQLRVDHLEKQESSTKAALTKALARIAELEGQAEMAEEEHRDACLKWIRVEARNKNLTDIVRMLRGKVAAMTDASNVRDVQLAAADRLATSVATYMGQKRSRPDEGSDTESDE